MDPPMHTSIEAILPGRSHSLHGPPGIQFGLCWINFGTRCDQHPHNQNKHMQQNEVFRTNCLCAMKNFSGFFSRSVNKSHLDLIIRFKRCALCSGVSVSLYPLRSSSSSSRVDQLLRSFDEVAMIVIDLVDKKYLQKYCNSEIAYACTCQFYPCKNM